MIGRTLDRYRIEEKLGEGGMGVVYLARDTHLERPVAIKVLPRDSVADPARKQRFVQEAKAASALNHPGIITVHDVGFDAGVDFIVMEYVDGRTLDQVIPARGLETTRALRYAVQIADALARAHEAGIVHRDLKPSNLILTADDRLKILDFGIAKLLDSSGRADQAATRTALVTEAGQVVGTAAYMSPEQAEGRKVDARSDIFSFGAVLYEMVTGRRPFEGDSALSVLAGVVNDDPPAPRTPTPGLPHEVERAILRCLRKDAGRRYQTMADLKVALDDLAADALAGQVARAPVVRGGWDRRWAWAAVTAVAIAGSYAAWQSARSPASGAPPLRAVPLTALRGVVRSPSLSPDGNHVVFTWTGPKQDNVDLYVQQIGAGSHHRLTSDPADDYSPAWSPDGQSIAFLRRTADRRRHELRLIPPLGGSERKLIDIQPRGFLRAVTLAWCPDSRCVVVTDASSPDPAKPDALFVVALESRQKRQLTAPADQVLADTDPAVSPDGRRLVFRRDISPFSGQLQVVGLASDRTVTSEPRALTPVLLSAYGPKWISNEEIIFSAKSSLWRLNVDQGTAPERLPFVGDDGVAPSISRSRAERPARLVYVRSFSDTNIWRMDTAAAGAPASRPAIAAIASSRRDALAQFSADLQKVTFISDRSGESEIWVADSSGDHPVQLTRLGATPGYPRWSPDGSTIAFHCNSEARATGAIFVVPADGGEPRRFSADGPVVETFPSFSRDGRWLYFSSTRTGTPLIWKMPATGGDALKVSPTTGLLGIESWDGTQLYYVDSSISEAPGPLLQLPLAGGKPVKLVDNVMSTTFEVVERGIYYFERLTGDARLRFYDFATRQSTVVADKLGTLDRGVTASRDGRSILYSRVDSSLDDLMLVESFR